MISLIIERDGVIECRDPAFAGRTWPSKMDCIRDLVAHVLATQEDMERRLGRMTILPPAPPPAEGTDLRDTLPSGAPAAA